jgi:hypothetical protein
MVQIHKQPLEFFSKQHHAHSGNFKAKPIYQSSKPVTQISTIQNNPSQMSNPFQKNKHSYTTKEVHHKYQNNKRRRPNPGA